MYPPSTQLGMRAGMKCEGLHHVDYEPCRVPLRHSADPASRQHSQVCCCAVCCSEGSLCSGANEICLPHGMRELGGPQRVLHHAWWAGQVTKQGKQNLQLGSLLPVLLPLPGKPPIADPIYWLTSQSFPSARNCMLPSGSLYPTICP